MPGPVLRDNRWYLHDRVPVDVARAHRGSTVTVTLAGQQCVLTLGTQVKLSLQTSDRDVAVERYLVVSGQLGEAYAKLRQIDTQVPIRLTDRQCAELAGVYFQRWKVDAADDPGDASSREAGDDVAFELGRTPKGREKLHGIWANDLLAERDIRADPESRDRLLMAMHWAYLDAGKRITDAARGDWAGMRGGDERYPEPVEVKAKPKLTLAEVRDEWIRDREARNKATGSISMFRHYFGSLVEFLGGNDRRDATTVTPEDIEGWLRWLGEKVGRNKKQLSRKTIGDGYLTLVRAAFEQSRRKLTSWPFEGIKFEVGEKPRERYQAYSDAEAAQILGAAQNGTGVGPERSEHVRRAIRWVPWICAYTGARVGEIVQLRKQDFMEERGIKFIRITPEAGPVKNKKLRDVPLHGHLIEQGLWDVVDHLNGERVFFSPDMKNGASLKNRITDWVWQGAGITDKRMQPSHAWRHRFMTEARDVMPDQVMKSIAGHATVEESEKYGHVKLATKAKFIEQMPRIEVP